LDDALRKTDYAARYGGDEFVVILPETSLPRAEELAERLRNLVARHPIPIGDGKELNLTASIGIAVFPEQGPSGRELLAAADMALYTAKREGRNRVHTASNSR